MREELSVTIIPVGGVKVRFLAVLFAMLAFVVWVGVAWSSISKIGPKIILLIGAALVFAILIHFLLQTFEGCRQVILRMDALGMSLQGGNYDEKVEWDELRSITLAKINSGKRWQRGIVIELQNHRRILFYNMYKIGIEEIFLIMREHVSNYAFSVHISVEDVRMY